MAIPASALSASYPKDRPVATWQDLYEMADVLAKAKAAVEAADWIKDKENVNRVLDVLFRLSYQGVAAQSPCRELYKEFVECANKHLYETYE